MAQVLTLQRYLLGVSVRGKTAKGKASTIQLGTKEFSVHRRLCEAQLGCMLLPAAQQ